MNLTVIIDKFTIEYNKPTNEYNQLIAKIFLKKSTNLYIIQSNPFANLIMLFKVLRFRI